MFKGTSEISLDRLAKLILVSLYYRSRNRRRLSSSRNIVVHVSTIAVIVIAPAGASRLRDAYVSNSQCNPCNCDIYSRDDRWKCRLTGQYTGQHRRRLNHRQEKERGDFQPPYMICLHDAIFSIDDHRTLPIYIAMISVYQTSVV